MSQNQDYDKIIRENIEKAIPSLIGKLCNLHPEKLEDLPTSLQKTRERRPDFLKRARSSEPGGDYIVHVEFQTDSDSRMHKRMLEQYSLIFSQHDLLVEQFVIFIGRGKPRMKTQIRHKRLKFSYPIIVMSAIDFETFANSDNPGEIVLAILGDFKGEESAEVIRTILTNLNKNVRDKRTLHKFLTQLEILSNLRNLQPEIVKQVEAMPITYDITTDIRYQQGMQAGELLGKRKTVTELLKMGDLSLQKIAKSVKMPIDFVIEIQNEMTTKKKK